MTALRSVIRYTAGQSCISLAIVDRSNARVTVVSLAILQETDVFLAEAMFIVSKQVA
jgi:hypothetical protein